MQLLTPKSRSPEQNVRREESFRPFARHARIRHGHLGI